MELDNSVSVPEETASSNEKKYHTLHDNWTLWAHLPHDTDWTVKSYKKIMTFTTVEQALVLYETLPDKMIKNCMLFLMREGIQPTWEDEKNRGGGCFSYKVGNKNIITTWKHASYSLIGETLTAESKLCASINGITISPKKNFCIIKIWLGNCDFQNPQKITEVAGIVPQGCLFKKHTPQY
jgi:hypothetical protein|tara:strand:+ start:77 stop:619 length:543 start_codon:yes stop_codon:yes gene_type:complete